MLAFTWVAFMLTGAFRFGILSKIDRTGLLQWTRVATSNIGTLFTRIILTPDSGFIILGGTSTNYFLVKIDPLGNWVWTRLTTPQLADGLGSC